MKKQVRIVKKGRDNGNIEYWLSLTKKQRMRELQQMREQVNARVYGVGKGFQRVYRIVKRA